ncbi:hypothetical protein HYT25_00780 [Candidatus Pacearchaeota archaeon]|nr:hypothetical protein [Candidatus Pacearchaeota archaeon]
MWTIDEILAANRLAEAVGPLQNYYPRTPLVPRPGELTTSLYKTYIDPITGELLLKEVKPDVDYKE